MKSMARNLFLSTRVNYQRLVYLIYDSNSFNLDSQIGIQDFAHIKLIAAAIRIATSQSEQNYRRSIADPYV